MKDTASQFALRQWWTQFPNPITLLILAGVAALLAILGPFETGEWLTFAPRFGYWLVTSGATYSLGLLVSTYLWRVLPDAMPLPLRVACAGLATGIAITPVVVTLNYLCFGYIPSAQEWPSLLLQFFAIALIVSVIFQAVSANQPEADAAVQPPALLDRLPLDKRGPIVALSSEDHYTSIRTTRGEELVLIRLLDAIREAEPTAGLQVHRSHWVELGQVPNARRDEDRAVLKVTGGADIPVSRANIAAIKDAGLLPQ